MSATVRAKITPTLTAQLAGDNLTAQHANGYLSDFLGGIPVPLVNGQLGYTASYSYGPEIVRLSLSLAVGKH